MKLFLMVLAFAATAHAQYPSPRPNHDLKQELEGDSQRLIPGFEHFNFAVDGDAWVRNLSTEDFYHGDGYWIQARTEARLSKAFTINVRSIFFAGSSSNGYAEATGFYNLIAFTGVWPGEPGGFQLKARVGDLERRTIGAGLLVQDRETNGAQGTIWNDTAKVTATIDSTGALVVGDDMFNADLELWHGWLGLGTVNWYKGVEQDNLVHNRTRYYYLYSTHTLAENLRYDFEAGIRNPRTAAMFALNYAPTVAGRLKIDTRAEYRLYEQRFGTDFVGEIQPQYVTYDQYDKAYTNAMDIFVIDDDVQVYAGHLDLHLQINPQWRAEWLNEVGEFNFKNFSAKDFWFYRAGIRFAPLEGRDDSIEFLVSNKVLTGSYHRPPSDLDLENHPLFKEHYYFAIEGRFRF